MRTNHDTIDAYIADFSPEVQQILQKVRQTIKAAAPKAEEAISYAIPTFKLNRNLVHFAAFKHHIGLYPPIKGNARLEKAAARYQGQQVYAFSRPGDAAAQEFADAGAAIVWGHHPHVLQRLAWVQGLGQAQPTLVAFSLGNALFDQYGLETTRRSALVLVTLDPGGVQEFKFIPFMIDIQNSRILEAGQKDEQIIGGYFK